MKRIFALILTALTLTVALSGCVREDMNIKLNKDGSAEMITTVALKLGFYNQLKDMNGVDPFDGKETVNVEYDGEKYVAVKNTDKYASFEEIEKALCEMTFFDTGSAFENETDGVTDITGETQSDPVNEEGENETAPEDNADTVDEYEEMSPESSAAEAMNKKVFKSVEIKKDRSKYIFHAVVNSVEGESFGYDISEALKVTIIVELPGKITAYKGGKVSDNVVTFDITDMSEETELYAESKTGTALPAVIGTVVILAGIAVVFIMRKKK